jgi:hypothetical protein
VEEKEKENVERGEGAEDAGDHDEKEKVVFLFALFDHVGHRGRGEGDDGAHQDEGDV